MTPLLEEIRHMPLLWLLVLVPVVLLRQLLQPEAHTLLFLLSVAAIIPLAALLSLATESVADKTGDLIGGLLNATLGNLTELLIALAALRAGQYVLVKASIEGAIVTNSLFMLGASFLLGTIAIPPDCRPGCSFLQRSQCSFRRCSRQPITRQVQPSRIR
jgi:Ca2+:H+ antiporter